MFEDSLSNNNIIEIHYNIEGRRQEKDIDSDDNDIESDKYDHIKCLFCHEYGDGKNGEGILIYVYSNKGDEIYAHYYCLLSTPQIYFDGKTSISKLIKKVINSKQFKDLVYYLYIRNVIIVRKMVLLLVVQQRNVIIIIIIIVH